jgi:hypothetical protein
LGTIDLGNAGQMECPKFWSSTAAILHSIHSALQYCVAFGVHAICICLIFVTSSISPLLESLVMQLLHHGRVMISSIGYATFTSRTGHDHDLFQIYT